MLVLAPILALAVIALAAWAPPALAQSSAWRSLSSVVWGAGLPAFSYPFHKKPLILYDGGTTKQVGTYNFPVSKGMAGVYMTLEPGAIRELHWHANAAEWAYVIEGRTRITLTSPEGKVEISDVDAGGLWYFPRGWGHSIEGLGPGNAKFLLVFNDGTFSEGATFSITDWISHTPVSWVAQNLGISPEQVNRFPKKEVYISRRPPAPGPLATTKPRGLGIQPLSISHVYALGSQKPIAAKAGSTIRLATAREFPASFNMAGGLIHLEPGAMRQLHWHPNADEWQYVLNGEMELSVFASEGKASMSKLVAGDVGYVPKGYGHALRNDSSKPVDILVVFNDGDYQSIDLDGWIATNPDSVLGNTFQVPAGIVEALPRRSSIFSVR
ncbi:cupin domain-containing protein [Vulcanococcus limneticus]|uniref:cupin domain-containing protein n=1 Tax=Vulcanococcus limneticus TaxID=2170428 RepID=UPI000B98A061|nr:cupin domain-containing protein [Vulcanococcus limneticus MW73D5]MCP9892365.1 cupin domain-containing protein [Vulcanococcus limneticus Candia 3F8]MCP9895813.1 cupin domain-containing protein [Vulcanococcus limneticus Candia 3B3]